MLTLAKLGAHSVAYYESTVERDGRGADGLTTYYAEGNDVPPRVLVAGRNQAAAAAQYRDRLLLEDGAALTAEQVAAWFGQPVAPNGEPLGRPFGDRSVRGYDLTFAAPKSVSLLAVFGGERTAAEVTAAHRAAIGPAMAYLSEHAGYTRIHNRETGRKDVVPLAGLSAAVYEHGASRADDPHLHTHVLLHNRQLRHDGRVGSLDGTSLYHEARAAGMVYQATLRAGLAQRLGVRWRAVDPDTGMADLVGMEQGVLDAWSRRRREIDDWVADRCDTRGGGGRDAGQTATGQRATREAKKHGRDHGWDFDPRAAAIDTAAVLDRAPQRDAQPSPEQVLAHLAERRSTFTRADVVESIGALWQTPDQPPRRILDAFEELAGRVLAASVQLSPDPVHQVGRRHGHEREGSLRYSSTLVLQQEARLLQQALAVDLALAASTRSIPQIEGIRLSPEQAAAVAAIAASPQRATPLVAAAGTGKTTALAALRSVYEADGRTVVGLAPTGRAADEMVRAGAAGSAATIASLLLAADNWRLSWDARTVVVIDEAGMVSTPHLARLVDLAERVGGKVVLVGDPAQLAPVKARGGAFEMLAADSPDTATLSEVWRQRDAGERQAGLCMRDGSHAQAAAAADWYARTGRLVSGSPAAMLDDAYAAWSADMAAGRDALLLAPTRDWVAALNARAQHDRTAAGQVNGQRAQIGERQQAGCGDIILSTRNDRDIPVFGDGRRAGGVRNGQRWQVARVGEDGSLLVRRLGDGAAARLPAEYSGSHVRLGYATTVHAAQGATADTCHALLDAATSRRSQAYVAATRGRDATRLYIAERRAGDDSHQHAGARPIEERRDGSAEATDHLLHIIGREDRDRSAHDVLRELRHTYRSAGGLPAVPLTEADLLDRRRASTGAAAADALEHLSACSTDDPLAWDSAEGWGDDWGRQVAEGPVL